MSGTRAGLAAAGRDGNGLAMTLLLKVVEDQQTAKPGREESVCVM